MRQALFRRRTTWHWASAFCLVVSVRAACLPWFPLWPDPQSPVRAGRYLVTSVDRGCINLYDPLDPNTCAKVKLLGIELPHAFSSRSERFLKQLLTDRVVRLRLDRRRMDADQTQLAYLYLHEKLVNAEMVRHGYARAASRRGDYLPIIREIESAEHEARSAGRGIWRHRAAASHESRHRPTQPSAS